MKRIVLLSVMFVCTILDNHAFFLKNGVTNEVTLTVSYHDPTDGNNSRPRSPIEMPRVFLDDHTLYINGVDGDYILQLETADGVAYTLPILGSTGSDTVVLPSSLSGSYELCIYTGYYCFSGDIDL